MFRFFKRREKEEPSEEEIAIDDVPAWLSRFEEETTVRLDEETKVHRDRAKAGIEEIRRLVGNFPGMDREEAYHPKLEKIARNTLPLYVKSMQSSLAKELPESPDEFYAVAGEYLKGSVKAAAGPGRYLQAVFPSEMKAIRAATDVVGKEVNAMTPAIRDARRRRELIAQAHSITKELEVQLKDLTVAEANLPAARASIAGTKEELVSLEKEIAVTGSPAEASEADRLASSVRDHETRLEELTREFANLRATAMHVIRKTEKVSSRREDTRLAKELHRTVTLLEGNTIPDEHELLLGLTAVLPAVMGLIESGETELKNKEEKQLFSGPDTLPRSIKEFYEAYWNERRARDEANAAYQAHPVVVRKERLIHDRAATERRLANLESTLTSMEERVETIRGSIPALKASLEGHLKELAGKPAIIAGLP